MSFYKRLIYTALSAAVLSGCSKQNNEKVDSEIPPAQCSSLTGIKVNVSSTVLEKGQPLAFSASFANGLIFSWKTPAGRTVTSATSSIQNIDFADEGWYVLEVKNNCNQSIKDSVFVDVKVPQGEAPCSPFDNTVAFSATHPGGTFTNVTQGESGIQNDAYWLNAWGGGNEFSVAFHPSYKNNNQPENGIYTTGTYNSNGNFQFGTKDYDKVFVTNITYSPSTINYKAAPGQKVYVTRVNGKLKVILCPMSFTGTFNGSTYYGLVAVSVTEQ